MAFELSFAGIPFCLDTAKIVRMDHKPGGMVPPEELEAPRKHQPMADLIDELNKLLPCKYLQDFQVPGDYPGRDLGALAYRSHIGPYPNPSISIGDWYYPTTASRWSVFRGLATSTAVAAMIEATNFSQGQGCIPETFIMQCDPLIAQPMIRLNDPAVATVPGVLPQTPANRYRLSSQMYMLPPRPLADHGQQFDGLYLVTLVDERYYFQNTPVSLKVRRGTTWTSLINQCANALNILTVVDIPAVFQAPEPDSHLWSSMESAAVLLDAIAYNIGDIVVRTLDGRYNFLYSYESQTIAKTNRGNATQVLRLAGGEIISSGIGNKVRNEIIPEAVKVTFPKYVIGNDPVPHFLNSRYLNPRPTSWFEESFGDDYVVTVPIASGNGVFLQNPFVRDFAPLSGLTGVRNYFHTIHDTAKALYNSEFLAATTVPINNAGLVNLSMELGASYFQYQTLEALDEVYPGTYNWIPEGYHDLIWTFSARAGRACTRVMKTQWNQSVKDMQHGTPPPPGFAELALVGSELRPTGPYIPKGMGGPSVAQTIRDSEPDIGYPARVNTLLAAPLGIADTVASFESVAYFPTQNRWRGRIENEDILFDGTSGGIRLGQVTLTATNFPFTTSQLATAAGAFFPTADISTAGDNITLTEATLVTEGIFVPGDGVVLATGDPAPFTGILINNPSTLLGGGVLINNMGGILDNNTTTGNLVTIAYRAIDGTLPAAHVTESVVNQIAPSVTYGVNLSTYEKMSYTYPAEWTSGGIMGMNVVPQTQSVFVFDDVGKLLNGITHYSGAVNSYDTTLQTGFQWGAEELIWIVERNDSAVTKNFRYDGQLLGYSPQDDNSPVAPVYAIDTNQPSTDPSTSFGVPTYTSNYPAPPGTGGALDNSQLSTLPCSFPAAVKAAGPPYPAAIVAQLRQGFGLNFVSSPGFIPQETSLSTTPTQNLPPTVGPRGNCVPDGDWYCHQHSVGNYCSLDSVSQPGDTAITGPFANQGACQALCAPLAPLAWWCHQNPGGNTCNTVAALQAGDTGLRGPFPNQQLCNVTCATTPTAFSRTPGISWRTTYAMGQGETGSLCTIIVQPQITYPSSSTYVTINNFTYGPTGGTGTGSDFVNFPFNFKNSCTITWLTQINQPCGSIDITANWNGLNIFGSFAGSTPSFFFNDTIEFHADDFDLTDTEGSCPPLRGVLVNTAGLTGIVTLVRSVAFNPVTCTLTTQSSSLRFADGLLKEVTST